jgi:hypothetical protein
MTDPAVSIPSDFSDEITIDEHTIEVSVSPCCSMYEGLALQIDATLTQTGQHVIVSAGTPFTEAGPEEWAALVARIDVGVCSDDNCYAPRLVIEDGRSIDGTLCEPCRGKKVEATFAPGGLFDQFCAKHAHRAVLTSVKWSKSNSEETECFDAKLTWDGKRLGGVENSGRGGPHKYEASDDTIIAIHKELKGDPMYDGGIDIVVDRALVEWGMRRDAQRHFGAGKVSWLVSKALPSLGGQQTSVKWPEVLQTWQTGGKEEFLAEAITQGWVKGSDLPNVVWFPDVYLDGIETARRVGEPNPLR